VNAAEHYKAAEHLAARAEAELHVEHGDVKLGLLLAELATAHATMANAAATIDAAEHARQPRVLYRG